MGEYICEAGFFSSVKSSLFVYALEQKQEKRRFVALKGGTFDFLKKNYKLYPMLKKASYLTNRKRKKENN